MRSYCVAVLLLGCNQIYGLDQTRVDDAGVIPDANPATDEDLDGILNEVDNCPGVPNPEQGAVADLDPTGDACDPDDSAITTIVARYFFNDAGDQTHFVSDAAFSFNAGFVDIARTAAFSYMNSTDMLAFARGSLTVEAGFELVELETGARVGVYTDGPDVHYAWVELRPEPFVVVLNQFPPPAACSPQSPRGCDEEPISMLPERIVVQLRSGAMRQDGLKVILAPSDADASYDAAGTFANKYGIVVSSAHARLHHVIVYAGQ